MDQQSQAFRWLFQDLQHVLHNTQGWVGSLFQAKIVDENLFRNLLATRLLGIASVRKPGRMLEKRPVDTHCRLCKNEPSKVDKRALLVSQKMQSPRIAPSRKFAPLRNFVDRYLCVTILLGFFRTTIRNPQGLRLKTLL